MVNEKVLMVLFGNIFINPYVWVYEFELID